MATTTTSYAAHLVADSDPDGSSVEIGSFVLSELRGRGWIGYMIPASGAGSLSAGVELPDWLKPGRAVRLRLSGGGTRSWVSVVTSVTVMLRVQYYRILMDDTPECREFPSVREIVEGAYGELDDLVRFISVADPLSFLWDRPVWDVFRDCSAGELLGGAMSLAGGGDGRPTLTPFADLPDLPRVRIREIGLSEAAQSVQPYVIATGESLGDLLGSVLGPFGIRIEMRESATEEIVIELHTQAPSTSAGNLVRMALESGGDARDDNAIVHSLSAAGFGEDHRTGVLDPLADEPSRVGEASVVGSVLSTDLPAGAATERLDLMREARSDATALQVDVDTRAAGMLPGKVVRFTNQTIERTRDWQVTFVLHLYGPTGNYRNHSGLSRAEVALRTPPPPDRAPVVVSAMVNEAETERDETLVRDEFGRIPLTCIFSGEAWRLLPSDADDESTPASTEPEGPVRVNLSLIEPLAGGMHGFLPAHREGDYCRVLVHDPFHAEVLGFVYDESRRVSKGYVHEEETHDTGRYTRQRTPVETHSEPESVSGGVILHHYDGQWTGLAFNNEDDAD